MRATNNDKYKLYNDKKKTQFSNTAGVLNFKNIFSINYYHRLYIHLCYYCLIIDRKFHFKSCKKYCTKLNKKRVQ